jgi:Zn-dependent protease with chaperone function
MSFDLTEGGAESHPTPTAIYFDGKSSRRRQVMLAFGDRLEIHEPKQAPVYWPYADIRQVDGPSGILRVMCLSAPVLARLEIRDAVAATELVAHCPYMDEALPGRHGVGAIVGWSLAAAVSIAAVVLVAIPFAADRLAPLIPESFERRLGDAAETQVRTVFGARTCNDAAGQQAFSKLVNSLRQPAGLDTSVQALVLATDVPNAFALPGGKVYLFDGLLAKAQSADEIAGVLAHELGHLKHRDNTRALLYNGGTSFLIGLLFGDVTGSGAAVFAARSLVTTSYSRDAETNADSFSIEVMHTLGRPTRPMGELMFRVTGKQGNNGFSILAGHPLTEDRLKRMSEEDRPASGPPLLTTAEWASLKSICSSQK